MATLTNRPLRQGKTFTLGKPRVTGRRVGVYGAGGIGKTSLGASVPGTKAIFDLEDSIAKLDGLPADVYNSVVPGIETFQDIRDALASDCCKSVDNIVIDTATRVEQLAVAHTIRTVPHEKGNVVNRIEDYGFGKGYQHVYDTFELVLGDLDAHFRAGRNVILIMHDCFSNVPNPQGDDYIRYEPRLQTSNSGKASIRSRVREWLDDLCFLGYDVNVRENKATGSGTRTIYPVERPHCMAKSRKLDASFEYPARSIELWTKLGIKEAK